MATANDTDNSNINDECSICLVPLSQQGLDIFTTACHHQFHFQCLAKNIQAQNNECPLCRTGLDSLVNILNASSNTATPVPTDNVPVQQVAPIQTVPIQQQVPVQSASPPNNTGVWNSLTHTLRNTLNWVSGNSNVPTSSAKPTKNKT